MDRKQLQCLAAVFLAAGVLFGGFFDQDHNQHAVRAGEPWDAAPMDWPYWRGPEMNGVSREKNLPVKWAPDTVGENNLIWKNEKLATRSTPIVMDGLLYTLVRDQPGTKMEGEKVVCADAATGEIQWENRFNVYLSDVPDTRVAWSCVVGDPKSKKVFALGVCGYFQCLDAKTGKTLWSHSLSEEYGLLSTYGGRTNMPITYKNLVIISAVIIGWGDMAKPAHRFMAFDQRNGEMVWFNGTRLLPDDTTYSAPVLTAFNGEPAMVFASGDGSVDAFQPETGKQIWSYDVSARGISTTPLVVGDKVICGHNQENLDTTKMGALFCLDGTHHGPITGPDSGELWRKTEMYVGKGAPIEVDGKIFAISDPSTSGTLLCVDLQTGKLLKEQRLGGPAFSSPISADGKVYLLCENGRWWVFKPTKDGFDVVERDRLRIGDVHGSPIVSHGRMYIPTSEAMYCIGDADAEPTADKRPEPPTIPPAANDPVPAQAAVCPVETWLEPGERQPLQIRLYNKNGQFIGLAADSKQKVEYKVDGVGQVKNGVYVAPTDPVTDQALITAKIGDISGSARIRVIPPLPWSYNFDNGEIPVTWVGIRYRHIPIDFDLLQKLKKQNPMASELYIYLMSSFINSGLPAAKYDDSTPRKGWTDFANFMKLQDSAGNLEESKAKIDPLLEILKGEQVVSAWKWEEWSKKFGEDTLKGIRLTVNRGPRKIDGNGVMMKITTIPKGMRSQGWMGPVDLSNYTIEADVYASEKEGRLPDIGLVAQRYTLDLMGASQQLQIRTWTPQLRMAQNTPFQWKPRIWYRLKFRTEVQNGKAVLKGKVWERDKPEPKDWTVEAEDPTGNLTGSPGTFGNAKDAELFYDNIKVYSNGNQKG